MQQLTIVLIGRTRPEELGFLPGFLNPNDPDKAREQFDKNYQHGGGWRPISGFLMSEGGEGIQYPGDPEMKPIAMTMLREEVIQFYRYGFVCILQPDNTFEVARLD